MHETLFHIPFWLFEGPLVIAWLVVGLAVMGVLVWRQGWSAAMGLLPVWVIGAALLWFVIPNIAVSDVDPGDPFGPPVKVGLAVRGYGVMVLLGLLAGVAMTAYRARREGLRLEPVLTAIFVAVVCGIVGARSFYVIQKFDEFSGQPPLVAIGEMLNMTEGGLVVYGSLIGGAIGGWIYMKWARLPVLRLADIAAPGMVAGLAFGRIGCLLNGCCFGGVCDIPSLAMPFPAGSPPYMRQLHTGELLGIESSPVEGDVAEHLATGLDWRLVRNVAVGSIADEHGLDEGDWFRIEMPMTPASVDRYLRLAARGVDTGLALFVRTSRDDFSVDFSELPRWSLGTSPTQVLAAINAALLAAVLWFWFPLRRRDGQVFAMLLVLYAITRFLMEIIRQDEYGLFGTDLTISQFVSIGMFVVGGILFVTGRRRAP
jgi:phosphatidylglycerol:prolipoprotein diacylglycerol transferase